MNERIMTIIQPGATSVVTLAAVTVLFLVVNMSSPPVADAFVGVRNYHAHRHVVGAASPSSWRLRSPLPRRGTRRPRRAVVYTTGLPSSSSNDNDNEEWRAGNLQQDLDNLRLAVSRTRGEDGRKEYERLRLLDEFARQRRPPLPDLGKYVILPVVLSACLTSIPSSTLTKALYVLVDVHFWAVVVTSPLLLLFLRLGRNTNNKTRKTDHAVIRQRKTVWQRLLFRSQDKRYNDYVRSSHEPDGQLKRKMRWMTPKTKRYLDPALLLLQQWASAVFGTVLYCAWCAWSSCHPTTSAVRATTRTRQGLFLLLSTRLAAAAAVRQYPQLQHDLASCDRPLPESTALLRPLLTVMTTVLPIGFACDLARLVVPRPRATSSPVSLLFVLALCGPVCHLFAWCRLLQLQRHTTNQPVLSQDYETAQKTLRTTANHNHNNNNNNSHNNNALRYSLRWRTPEPLTETLRKWYHLVLAGYASQQDRDDGRLYASFADRSAREYAQERESKLPPTQQKTSPPLFRNELLRLEAKRMHNDPQALTSDRRTWVPSAVAAVSRQHEEDYEDGVFDDYLGVALHKTVGVGLSFRYDHDTALNVTSVHRLRARAAKSAAHYVRRELFDPAQLEGVDNEEERTRLRTRDQAEVDRLADTLLDLVPTDYGDPPEGTESLAMQCIAASETASYDSMVAEVGRAPELAENSLLRREYGDAWVDDLEVSTTREKEEESSDERRRRVAEMDSWDDPEYDHVLGKPDDDEGSTSVTSEEDEDADDFTTMWLEQYKRNTGYSNETTVDTDDEEIYLA